MSDIAFILLLFFLMISGAGSEEGIDYTIPPKQQNATVEVNQRNVLSVVINAENVITLNGKTAEISEIKSFVKNFITNNGVDPDMSVNPLEAMVNFQISRAARYEGFLMTYNEIKAAYHELRATEVGITPEEFMTLDMNNEQHKMWYGRAKAKYPLKLSIVELESK